MNSLEEFLRLNQTMKPEKTDHLYSLREEIAALAIVKCRMSHERALNEPGSMLPIKSKLYLGKYERIGLCSHEVRAQRLGCSHTTARIRLADAVDELMRETDLAAGWSEELRYLDNEIHLLDHRKGEAETVLAREQEESCRAVEPARLDAKVALAKREVHDLERLHDEFVGRIGALRDCVIAEIDRLIGTSPRTSVTPALRKFSAPSVTGN